MLLRIGAVQIIGVGTIHQRRSIVKLVGFF